MSDEHDPSQPPHRDPRLEIPQVLRTPVRKADLSPMQGGPATGQSTSPEVAGAGRAWATAMDFVFTILAGALLGWLADRWRHSIPLWTMVGLALGFVTAFIRIVRATQREERDRRGR